MIKINIMKKSIFFFGWLFFVGITGYSQELFVEDSLIWSIDIDDIVITAQYAPTDTKNAVHRVRTIKREAIEQKGATNLEQLLGQELNIRVAQDMILGSSINLQGVSGQNVQIMVDGIPVIGRVGNNIDLSQINLHNIERVEIVEGPLSVNYGTNALGGVINLITKKSQLKPLDIHLDTKWESLGRTQYNAALGVRPVDQVLLSFHGGYNEFGGYTPDILKESTGDRAHLWNPKEQTYFGAAARYDFKNDQQLRYAFDYFIEDVTNLGEIRRPEFKPYAFDDYYHTERQDHSLLYEGMLSDQFFLKSTIGFNTFVVKKSAYRLDFEENEENLVDNAQDTTSFNALVFRPVIASKFSDKKLNFQLGLDLHYEDSAGKRIKDETSEKENFSALGDYAVFGSLQYQPIEKMLVQAGARVAHNTKFKAPVVPSVNIKYSPTDQLTLRASYAKGFRSPSLKELYFYFVDANHSVLGNENLQAETSDNVQLTLNWQPKVENHTIEASVTGFFNDIQQKIDLYQYVIVDGELVPATQEDAFSIQYAYFNQSRFKTVGGDFRLKYSKGNFNFNIATSPIGRYNLLSETADDVTPFTFVLESGGEIGYRFPKQNLQLTFYLKYNDKLIQYYQDVDVDNNPITGQLIQDGYTLSDFTVSKSLLKKSIQLTAGAQNLFDVQNVSISGFAGGNHTNSVASAVATGRSYFMTLSWNFSK